MELHNIKVADMRHELQELGVTVEQLITLEEKLRKFLLILIQTPVGKYNSLGETLFEGSHQDLNIPKLDENELRLYNKIKRSPLPITSVLLTELRLYTKLVSEKGLNSNFSVDIIHELKSRRVSDVSLKMYALLSSRPELDDKNKAIIIMQIQDSDNNTEKSILFRWMKSGDRKDEINALKSYRNELNKFFKELEKIEMRSTIENIAKNISTEKSDYAKYSKFTDLINHRFINDPASAQFKKVIECFIEHGPKAATKELEHFIKERKRSGNTFAPSSSKFM